MWFLPLLANLSRLWIPTRLSRSKRGNKCEEIISSHCAKHIKSNVNGWPMFVLLRERTMQHSIFAHHNSSTSDSTSCGILCTRRVCNNKLSRLSPRGTTLILHVPNCMLCALFYLPCIATQLCGCGLCCGVRACGVGAACSPL